MATRATVSIARREEGVSFSEKPNKTIVDIYHHYDGYPEGLGVKLASYLDDKKITNGLGSRDDYDYFNGLGCICLLYTSPSPRDRQKSRMPSSA